MADKRRTLDTNELSLAGKEFHEFLTANMIGQERAIRHLVRAYELYLSPFANFDKPAVFHIFAGPSGVGKTFLAELTAEFLLGNRGAMTKIDCTRITHGHEVSSLVGSPPGYVSTNKNGELDQEEIDKPASDKLERALLNDPLYNEVEGLKLIYEEAWHRDKNSPETAMAGQAYLDKKVRLDGKREKLPQKVFPRSKGRMPSIVLFDEIEKAHPDAHNILMEIADAGKLKMLNTGATTSFRNSFVFLTSNAGSLEIKKELGQSGKVGFANFNVPRKKDPVWEIATRELGKIFKPEFIGRSYNNIVVFRELKPEEIKKIIEHQLALLYADFLNKAKARIVISDNVFNMLFEEVLQHPEYGARPIRQKIEDEIKIPLAILVGSGQVGANDQVYVELFDGKIQFSKTSYLPASYYSKMQSREK